MIKIKGIISVQIALIKTASFRIQGKVIKFARKPSNFSQYC